jgi:hypothetical protein
MYFSFNKDAIINEYPIFTTEADCILDLFSLDMVKDMDFGKALYAMYPNSYDKLFECFFKGKIESGNILPYRKSKPLIMHIPTKQHYNVEADMEILRSGLIKFSENYHKLDIETVAIQETKFIKKELIEEIIKDLTFPKIIYYKKNTTKK